MAPCQWLRAADMPGQHSDPPRAPLPCPAEVGWEVPQLELDLWRPACGEEKYVEEGLAPSWGDHGDETDLERPPCTFFQLEAASMGMPPPRAWAASKEFDTGMSPVLLQALMQVAAGRGAH
mmetsp:Transcript_433/g.1064  ORF Transcript_433/g.1064 Transcript_433/m.1064 type:complete len:121 (+) Transcript_433:104-466(+)